MDRSDDVEIPLTAEQRVVSAIQNLPILPAQHVPLDEACPICLMSFASILDGSAQNEGVLHDVASKPIPLSGVTRLEGCGHVFCRVE